MPLLAERLIGAGHILVDRAIVHDDIDAVRQLQNQSRRAKMMVAFRMAQIDTARLRLARIRTSRLTRPDVFGASKFSLMLYPLTQDQFFGSLFQRSNHWARNSLESCCAKTEIVKNCICGRHSVELVRPIGAGSNVA
jgi:hypothetical protein